MNGSSISRAGAIAAALAIVFTGSVHAQQAAFPSKPIRLILPFAPGGPSDIVGRVLSQKMSEQMGQQVVTDNRAGAGGNLGLELAAKAPPDGHTLVIASPTLAISPSLYKKLNYDPQKDFAPLSTVANIPNVMLVHNSVPAKTVKEFIDLARRSPGKLNYGSSGAGSTTHLSSEILSNMSKLKMVHVPYKGQGLALSGLMSGQVDMMIMAVPSAQGMVQANKVRALAVLAENRVGALPSVPTMAEAGVKDFVVNVWFGVLAPAATPRDVVARLNSELVKTVAAPDVRERFTGAGIEPASSTPEQFGAYIRSETARYAKVIREAGITVE
jgi:tripartite-type tricarboxylate transporter receptor subunit TctC